MGQSDSVQTQTVAIVEPNPIKETPVEAEGNSHVESKESEEGGEELEEVVIMGGGQMAPLAQEEENLSLWDEDFATPEAVSPVNHSEGVGLATSISPLPSVKPEGTPCSPVDKTITPVVDYINGIQRCQSHGDTMDKIL